MMQSSDIPTPHLVLADAWRHLRALEFQPCTVLDVGVGRGTLSLYEAFPDARFILIDPLSEYEETYRRLAEIYKAEYVITALGSRSGRATLYVHADRESSSLLREQEGPEIDGAPRSVPVTTLDQICSAKAVTSPLLLKVDVQGYELEVLKGAHAALAMAEVVVLEVSFFEFYRGSPDISQVIEFMRRFEFVVYDLVGQLYRFLDGALAQADLVFVRAAGPFRRSHNFATPKQRTDMRSKV